MTTLTVVPTTCPASNAVKFEKGSEFGLNEGGGGIGEVEGQGLGEKEGDGSFSRSYGSILPTSLTYIILSTRGC